MKSTGILRKVDELGRIVVQKELRTVLGIDIRDEIEIYTDNSMIILKKFFQQPSYTVKSVGVVRKVDELGRIVIPKELRRALGINKKDALEIYTNDNSIVLKKYEPFCIFCGSSDNLFTFGGKNVCKACVRRMQDMLIF